MKLNYKGDIDKLFFTSDLHWFHDNIIKYCSRPFSCVKEMNEQLILLWNEVVPVDGTVFLLGDMAFRLKVDEMRELISRLNGEIYLIMGNHDYQNHYHKQKFVDLFGGKVYDNIDLKIHDEELEDNYIKLFLSHYPHMFWTRKSYHLHGHVHSGPRSTADEIVPYHKMRYDVGVDNNDFAPVSYKDLKIMFTKREMNE